MRLRLCVLLAVPLLAACSAFTQGAGKQPPKRMKLCIPGACDILTQSGDFYEGRVPGHNELHARYWVIRWDSERIEFKGKTVSDGRSVVAEGDFTGKIARDGRSVEGGIDEWSVAGGQGGRLPFTLTWNDEVAGAEQPKPPRSMRICFNGCDTMNLVGDHYEGHADGSPALTWIYAITQWDGYSFQIKGKSSELVEGVMPATGTFTGTIDPASKTGSGVLAVSAGFSTSNIPFTISWKPEDLRKGEITQQQAARNQEQLSWRTPRRSTKHPSILLPPKAAEEFADNPADVRAVLQPSAPLLASMAMLPCSSGEKVDGTQALEIAKFAYRAAEYTRANCWARRAENLGSVRAKVIEGVALMQGFGQPADAQGAFAAFEAAAEARDYWGTYFVGHCLSDGIGVAQDKMKGERLLTWVTLNHSEEVFGAMGSDDAEVMRVYREGLLFMNPPTKAQQVCSQDMRLPNSARCKTVYVLDEDRFNEEEQQIQSNPQ